MTSLFPDSGGADVLSVDLGWDADADGRTAIAFRTFSGVQLQLIPAERDLTALVCELASPKALVLLNIPIDGCEKLDARSPFRAILATMVGGCTGAVCHRCIEGISSFH